MSFSKQRSKKNNIFPSLLWFGCVIVIVVFSLGVSWQISKSANFFYSSWYDALDIDKVLSKHVPKNTQSKRDYPKDDKRLHLQNFANIVDAIHRDNSALALVKINYQNSKGEYKVLLTDAELTHLNDVALLLNKVSWLWWTGFFLLLLFIYYYRIQLYFSKQVECVRLPNRTQKCLMLASMLLVFIAILAIWGFTESFYFLHTLVFPVQHQWFFYYNDSLMSSLMKAPEIFAAIAAQLLLFALPLIWYLERFICRK
jgi:hypothetical protein